VELQVKLPNSREWLKTLIYCGGEFEFVPRRAIPLTFGIKGRFSANFIARALDFLHQEAYIIRRDRRKRKNKWYIC